MSVFLFLDLSDDTEIKNDWQILVFFWILAVQDSQVYAAELA